MPEVWPSEEDEDTENEDVKGDPKSAKAQGCSKCRWKGRKTCDWAGCSPKVKAKALARLRKKSSESAQKPKAKSKPKPKSDSKSEKGDASDLQDSPRESKSASEREDGGEAKD